MKAIYRVDRTAQAKEGEKFSKFTMYLVDKENNPDMPASISGRFDGLTDFLENTFVINPNSGVREYNAEFEVEITKKTI